MNQSCLECPYIYSPASRKFYCCDKKSSVCINCRRKLCQNCGKSRNNQLTSVRCKKCYSSARKPDDSDMFYQHQCDSFYCAKCLAKARVQKNQVILPCGHITLRHEWETFLRNFCSKCGEDYNPILDYELLDYTKVCFRCYRLFSHYYTRDMMKCTSCNARVQNTTQAGQANQDLIICKDCFRDSRIQEQQLEQVIKVEPPKPKQEHPHVNQIHHPKPEKDPQYQHKPLPPYQAQEKPYQISIKPPSNGPLPLQSRSNLHFGDNQPIIEQQIKIPMQKIKINQRKPQKGYRQDFDKQQPKPRHPPQKIAQVQSPPLIIQQRQPSPKIQQKSGLNKQLKHGSKVNARKSIDNELQKKPVLNKLEQSQKQEVLLSGQTLKIKKHLSSDTFVEDLKIEVEDENEELEYIQCANCRYQLPTNLTLKYEITEANPEGVSLCRLCYLVKVGSNVAFANQHGHDLAASRGRPTTTQKYTHNSPRKNGEKKTQGFGGNQSKDYYARVATHNKGTNDFLTTNFDRYNINPSMRSSLMGSQNKTSSYGKTEIKRFSKKCQRCGDQCRSFYLTPDKKELCINCYWAKN